MKLEKHIRSLLKEATKIPYQDEINAVLDNIIQRDFNVSRTDRVQLDRFSGNQNNNEDGDLIDSIIALINEKVGDFETEESNNRLFLDSTKIGGFAILYPIKGNYNMRINGQLILLLMSKFRTNSKIVNMAITKWAANEVGVNVISVTKLK